jgi:hypothetical protein
MSTSDAPPGQQKYYDPAEVEAYIRDVTETIKALQARLEETTRRADAAERYMGERNPETASLGRALLLAGEVADKTIADADIRAGDIIRGAEDRAVAIIEAANGEAQRLVDAAGGAAAGLFQKGEARLLAAVSAFMEGSNVLRSALSKIEEDAASWRSSVRGPQSPSAPPPTPPPVAPTVSPYSGSPFAPAPEATAPASRPAQPDLPGGVHNRAYRNGTQSDGGGPEPARVPSAQPDPFRTAQSPYPGGPGPREVDEPPPPTSAPYYRFPPPPAAGG